MLCRGFLNVTGVFLLFGSAGFGLFANSIFATATMGALTAVPLFIAVGEKFVVGLSLPTAFMLFLMMAVPFVLFMFLDQVALMLVLIPIFQPIIRIHGFDDIWFWTLFLIVVTVGGLTPPFGYILFALKSAAPGVPIETIFGASWPFVSIIVAGMVLFALFPELIIFLPRLMGSN